MRGRRRFDLEVWGRRKWLKSSWRYNDDGRRRRDFTISLCLDLSLFRTSLELELIDHEAGSETKAFLLCQDGSGFSFPLLSLIAPSPAASEVSPSPTSEITLPGFVGASEGSLEGFAMEEREGEKVWVTSTEDRLFVNSKFTFPTRTPDRHSTGSGNFKILSVSSSSSEALIKEDASETEEKGCEDEEVQNLATLSEYFTLDWALNFGCKRDRGRPSMEKAPPENPENRSAQRHTTQTNNKQ